jgi:hypothetical protein
VEDGAVFLRLLLLRLEEKVLDPFLDPPGVGKGRGYEDIT